MNSHQRRKLRRRIKRHTVPHYDAETIAFMEEHRQLFEDLARAEEEEKLK